MVMPTTSSDAQTIAQPITNALLHLSPALAATTRIVQLAAWHDAYASFLLLALWSFLCLAAPALFRYAFPILAALVLAWFSRPQRSMLVTEAVIQTAIADLTALPSALPTLPELTLPTTTLIRATVLLTVPWLVLTYLVPIRVLVTLLGCLLIVHRAPWACVLRSVLWKSAFVRNILHTVHAFLTGQPLPKYSFSNQPTPTAPAPVPSLRFLFAVYENQRWWVGLDWTAALLPSERPPWSSPTFHLVSPPSLFTLPDPTSVYLPSPDGKSTIKRTAIWKWDEPEWRLLVRKEGSSPTRIERTPPAIDDPSSLTAPSPSATSSGTRLLKAAANKFKDPSSSIISPPTSPSVDTLPVSQDITDRDHSDEPFTDSDGWIYGDNKWENQSHRGGLGKYTRSRRWTRVAVVHEVVQVVSPDTSAVHISPAPNKSQHSQPPITTTPLASPEAQTQSPEHGSREAMTTNGTTTPTPSSSAIIAPEPESPLRQRLRAALSKSSISSSSSL